MPLLNIYYQKGKDNNYIKTCRDVIHKTLIDTWNIPEKDCFQLFHGVDKDHFFIDPHMWDMDRSDDTLVIHITSMHRTTDMKLAFYQALPPALEKAVGLKPDDVFISIITNQREDWSFGKGIAQLL